MNFGECRPDINYVFFKSCSLIIAGYLIVTASFYSEVSAQDKPFEVILPHSTPWGVYEAGTIALKGGRIFAAYSSGGDLYGLFFSDLGRTWSDSMLLKKERGARKCSWKMAGFFSKT